MPLPAAYIVKGDLYRAVLEELEPYPEPEEDPQNWYPNEKNFLMFILGILGLQLTRSAAAVRKTQPLWKTSMEIDNAFNKVTWQNWGASKTYTDSFYRFGKRQVTEGFEVKTIVGAVDNHALHFLRHYNFDQISGLSNDMRMQVKRVIRDGVGNGRSMPQIAKNLQTKVITEPLRITSKNTGKVIRSISAEKRAMMIARTETMRAVNQGALIGYKQYGVTKVNVNTAGDGRVCPFCDHDSNNGPYEIDSPDLPYLPLHPYCRCTYSADLTDWAGAAFQILDEYRNLVTRDMSTVFESDLIEADFVV